MARPKNKLTHEEKQRIKQSPPDLMNVEEVAALLSVTTTTVREWIRDQNDFPALRPKPNGTIYVRYDELIPFMKINANISRNLLN